MQALVTRQVFQVDNRNPFVVGLQVGPKQGIGSQEVEVGVVNHGAATGTPSLACSFAIKHIIAGAVIFTALGGVLPCGIGFANGPGVKDQAGSGKHVACIFRGVPAIQNVTIFFTNLAFLHVQGAFFG